MDAVLPSIGLRARVAIAAAVVAAALATYYALAPARVAELRAYSDLEPWFAERVPAWRELEYIPLQDSERLASWLVECSGPRLSIVPQSAELVRDVRDFLQSLTVSDPDDYLRRVSNNRRLRPDVQDDAYVHARYRELTARNMPSRLTARELLAIFCRGHPQATARPVAVGRTAFLEVASTRPGARVTPERSATLLCAAATDQYLERLGDAAMKQFLRDWEPPAAQALVPVTEPTTSLSTVLERHQTTPIYWLRCVLRTEKDTYLLLDLHGYWSPDEKCWQVEMAATRNPVPVFWPR